MTNAADINCRPKSPPRLEAMTKALVNRPIFNTGVLIGNWVEDRIECPKRGTLYFPPKEVIDYDKLKPELRVEDYRQNKLNGQESNVKVVMSHDSAKSCKNYATTNTVVYDYLPKPLCGPPFRYYRSCQIRPQPDYTECYGNLTEWGLRKALEEEWKCSGARDYMNTLYEDTYKPPRRDQYLSYCERKAINSKFTKTFRYKMTKPLEKTLSKSKK